MRHLLSLAAFFLAIGFVSSCKKEVKGNAAKTTKAVGQAAKPAGPAKAYTIKTGSVNFTGSKVGGTHMGKFNINGGKVAASGADISSGAFTIDMNSLSVIDLKAGQGKEKLEGHLKSPDFFDTGANPTSTFVITSVAKSSKPGMTHNITGDLTLKKMTKSITFGANINNVGGNINAVSENFKINRTNWDVKYGSGMTGAVGDNLINDEVGITISFTANPS